MHFGRLHKSKLKSTGDPLEFQQILSQLNLFRTAVQSMSTCLISMYIIYMILASKTNAGNDLLSQRFLLYRQTEPETLTTGSRQFFEQSEMNEEKCDVIFKTINTLDNARLWTTNHLERR